jgi:hypothetical protein
MSYSAKGFSKLGFVRLAEEAGCTTDVAETLYQQVGEAIKTSLIEGKTTRLFDVVVGKVVPSRRGEGHRLRMRPTVKTIVELELAQLRSRVSKSTSGKRNIND